MTSTLAVKSILSILVVDDEAIVRESLGSWFREDGHHVDTAQDGREALRLLGRNHYDIALVDIKMPGMDGLELQGRVAAANRDLTIIIMTAYASVESAIEALRIGAHDYLLKPLVLEEAP